MLSSSKMQYFFPLPLDYSTLSLNVEKLNCLSLLPSIDWFTFLFIQTFLYRPPMVYVPKACCSLLLRGLVTLI